MTPTGTIVQADLSTVTRLRTYIGFDASFARDRGSGAGAIAAADRTVPHRVRLILRGALRQWGRPGLTESADLLATELVTNAFRHGLGDVGLRVYLTDSHLLIEVRDGSPEVPAPGNAALDDEDGRGLSLVAAIAEAWGVSPDGMTTWCSLPF